MEELLIVAAVESGLGLLLEVEDGWVSSELRCTCTDWGTNNSRYSAPAFQKLVNQTNWYHPLAQVPLMEPIGDLNFSSQTYESQPLCLRRSQIDATLLQRDQLSIQLVIT